MVGRIDPRARKESAHMKNIRGFYYSRIPKFVILFAILIQYITIHDTPSLSTANFSNILGIC